MQHRPRAENITAVSNTNRQSFAFISTSTRAFYDAFSTVSSGRFGTVYAVTHVTNRQVFTVRQPSRAGRSAEQIALENDIVLELSSRPFPCIIQAHDVVQPATDSWSPDVQLLVTDSYHMDMETLISRKGSIPANVLTFICSQVWAGLAHMHSMDMILGSYRHGNIAINCQTGSVKLANFQASFRVKGSPLQTRKHTKMIEVVSVTRQLVKAYLVQGDATSIPHRSMCKLQILRSLPPSKLYVQWTDYALRLVYETEPKMSYLRRACLDINWFDKEMSTNPYLRPLIRRVATWYLQHPALRYGTVMPENVVDIFFDGLGYNSADKLDADFLAMKFNDIMRTRFRMEAKQYFSSFFRYLSTSMQRQTAEESSSSHHHQPQQQQE